MEKEKEKKRVENEGTVESGPLIFNYAYSLALGIYFWDLELAWIKC